MRGWEWEWQFRGGGHAARARQVSLLCVSKWCCRSLLAATVSVMPPNSSHIVAANPWGHFEAVAGRTPWGIFAREQLQPTCLGVTRYFFVSWRMVRCFLRVSIWRPRGAGGGTRHTRASLALELEHAVCGCGCGGPGALPRNSSCAHARECDSSQ